MAHQAELGIPVFEDVSRAFRCPIDVMAGGAGQELVFLVLVIFYEPLVAVFALEDHRVIGRPWLTYI